MVFGRPMDVILFVLRIYKGWVPDELTSGKRVNGMQFRFYYLYRKEKSMTNSTEPGVAGVSKRLCSREVL